MVFKPKGWVILLLAVLLLAGCAPEVDEPLAAPGVRVYRPPQVGVTHAAPTALPTETATVEPGTTAVPVQAWPTMSDEEYEQYLMDEIEALLTKIESKLDRTDVNP